MRCLPLLAGFALQLAVPSIALAQDEPPAEPGGAAAPAPGQPAAPPPVQPPAPRPVPPPAPLPPAAPAVRWLATVGWDYGFEKLVTVVFSDGSTDTIRANGGFVLAAGARFLPLLSGQLETQATIGFKYDSIQGTNGSIRYTAFPLEVVEAWSVPPFRLALGASVSFGPSLSGSGAASDVNLDLRNSAGLLAAVEWSRPFAGARGSWLVGGRFLLQRMQLETGGPAADTNAVGLYAGLAY